MLRVVYISVAGGGGGVFFLFADLQELNATFFCLTLKKKCS